MSTRDYFHGKFVFISSHFHEERVIMNTKEFNEILKQDMIFVDCAMFVQYMLLLSGDTEYPAVIRPGGVFPHEKLKYIGTYHLDYTNTLPYDNKGQWVFSCDNGNYLGITSSEVRCETLDFWADIICNDLSLDILLNPIHVDCDKLSKWVVYHFEGNDLVAGKQCCETTTFTNNKFMKQLHEALERKYGWDIETYSEYQYKARCPRYPREELHTWGNILVLDFPVPDVVYKHPKVLKPKYPKTPKMRYPKDRKMKKCKRH